jgi:hypothetical protein
MRAKLKILFRKNTPAGDARAARSGGRAASAMWWTHGGGKGNAVSAVVEFHCFCEIVELAGVNR